MNEFVISGGEKFFFCLLKHVNKKLLIKYFPLIEDDFQFKIVSLPNIYINEQLNHCNISFSISLKNYTNYDFFVSFIEIALVVNDYHFLNYDKILLRNFKKKEGTQFLIELPITYYQVKQILEQSEHSKILNANFELKILTNNIFGDKVINKRLFGKIQVHHIPK